MPNGGTDCCGTCWFNRANRGRKGSRNHDREIPSYCEIRDFAIENPFYTYCANHPYRVHDRDPIPIGPVYRNVSMGPFDDYREPFLPSPDTEEIRQHLLYMLDNFFEHFVRDRYPIGINLCEAIIRQLGEFQEKRAEKHIE